MKKVLIIGNGAREHAMVWKLSQSSQVSQIWVAPGNPGTASEAKTENVSISSTDIPELIHFAKEKSIDLTIIGSELPLSLGIVDAFQSENLLCLGPTKAAAELETSKAFAKAFMKRHQIPSSEYAEFTEIQAAKNYLKDKSFPQVIKADGLAAGKGVIVAQNLREAEEAISKLLENSSQKQPSMSHSFSVANKKIIIEEFLEGFEVSFIILTDGKSIIPLATTQDNKRRNNGNKGSNTGGMGACSPAPYINETLEKQILEIIIKPTLHHMNKEGRPFQGFLFAGLMITPFEGPKVLEFNCRLGDPETQAILMRLQSDFFELCFNAAQKLLHKHTISTQWDKRPAISLVLATHQYPESTVENETITGIPDTLPRNTHIFHAGTALQNHDLQANGGRILTISAIDKDFTTIRKKVYALAKKIHWKSGVHYREDIGNFKTMADLSKKEREESEKNYMIKALSSSIAHDLRTPLSIIKINAHLIQMSNIAEHIPDALKRNQFLDKLKNMDQAIKECTQVVDMLAVKLKKIATPEISPQQMEECSILKTVQEALSEYPFREEEAVLIHKPTHKQKDFCYRGNQYLTKHVVFNLLKNSLRAIKEAQKGEIFIEFQRHEHYNCLILKDTALGITVDYLPKIFNEFETNDDTHSGVGLGLSFCKLVMESYKGQIECRSEIGKFTEFMLAFPKVSN